MTQTTCAVCGKTYDETQLNHSSHGLTCGMCELELDDPTASPGSSQAKGALAASAVAAVIGNAITMRKTSSSVISVDGVESGTIEQSANLPGLIGGGLAVLLAIAAVALTARLKVDKEGTQKTKKYAMIALGVVLLVWGAWTVVGALPSVQQLG